MGIQGSGKSTQGNLLSKNLGLSYLSSGHIFRQMAKEKTPWGRYVKETMNAGLLIPDSKVVPIIEEYVSKPEYTKGYILDGFPRTVVQAKAFRDAVDFVFFLTVSDREALWRLSYRNDTLRQDETISAVRKRIELFHTLTKPVITYYKKKGILVTVNGERPIRTIHGEIMEAIRKSKKA